MGAFRTDVARSYDAKPEQVFDAWVDPVSVKAWLAGGEKAIVDAREDGLFFIEMRSGDRNKPHYGRYLRVERPRLLEFTWVSEHTQGKESVVTIELAARDGKTELTLTHEGLPDQRQADGHKGGWGQFLESLTTRLR
jgi:uncharacterized protein YndB with AHSA1/START domain